MSRRIAILFPSAPGRAPGDPAASAFGRAALALAPAIDVVVSDRAAGGAVSGHAVRDGRWVPVTDLPVDAAWNRFPLHDRPDAWSALVAGLDGVRIGNPEAVLAHCLDKLACQRSLEGTARQPEVVDAGFEAALSSWGAGFLKPRYGAFGRGVRRVVPGDPLPTSGAWILQRAIAPPDGFAGISVRVLVQRDPTRGWIAMSGAARTSRTDPVVNHARGARVVPAADLLPASSCDALAEASVRIADHLCEGDTVELGADFVIDPEQCPWLVEVNGKPRGRLAALAAADPARFDAEHLAALKRPIEWLAR